MSQSVGDARWLDELRLLILKGGLTALAEGTSSDMLKWIPVRVPRELLDQTLRIGPPRVVRVSTAPCRS